MEKFKIKCRGQGGSLGKQKQIIVGIPRLIVEILKLKSKDIVEVEIRKC